MDSMEGQDLAQKVTRAEITTSSKPKHTTVGPSYRVVAYDFGIKQNIIDELEKVGCAVTIVPADTPADVVFGMEADGYFLSNGPGDPAAVSYGVEAAKSLIDSGKPVFGICLGHQILALAAGAKTYKLPFGHHGGNHPVQEIASKRIAITSQNHGVCCGCQRVAFGHRMYTR